MPSTPAKLPDPLPQEFCTMNPSSSYPAKAKACPPSERVEYSILPLAEPRDCPAFMDVGRNYDDTGLFQRRVIIHKNGAQPVVGTQNDVPRLLRLRHRHRPAGLTCLIWSVLLAAPPL